MHIPDGYLSPTTCAVMYATAAPFWYVALQRLKRVAETRLIPLLSVFSAFCFVVMMFNLPLPGGTTGHAVGVSLAAIVIGPWGAMLAVSVALAIQALFFGDGGVTALGANCFNMAITGALVSYACYRLLARGAPLRAGRRVVAAAIAGYVSINVSALFAAIEFGLQTRLFHDSTGAPLYAPYPLSVALPAMMIGHLTFAGLAEMVIAGGVVAYFQRSQIDLLRLTAPDSPDRDQVDPALKPAPAFATRKLWMAIGLLLILTPLGLLTVGSAWGEWSPQELTHQLATARAPGGLEHLYHLWRAPIADYSPAAIRSPELGYVASALIGVALILVVVFALQSWAGLRSGAPGLQRNFLERSIGSLLRSAERSFVAERLAKTDGLLQRLDARSKLAGLLALVIAAAGVGRLTLLGVIFCFALLLAVLSRIPIRTLALGIWIPVLSFTGLIALPALFLRPGHGFGWQVTEYGVRSASLLLLRAETASTLTALLILSTPWSRVLRALRFCRVPVVAVVILGMTYRYVFLFLKTALEMLESRRSRTLAELPGAERRKLAASAVGVLLSKSFQLSSDVHTAMVARGFRGEVYLLDEGALTSIDWLMLSVFIILAVATLIVGRV